MRPIGGFLGLELHKGNKRPYHDAIALNTGRSCFLFILQKLKPTRVYLPYFICDSLLQPLINSGMQFDFYSLDTTLELKNPPKLNNQTELIVYVNYFGLKSTYISTLRELYPDQLVVDDTQAFFQLGYPGLWSFNSARNFFGVPDGAYLYSPEKIRQPKRAPSNPAWDHLINGLIGNQEEGYQQFLEHESSLDHQMRSMSTLSSLILNQVDYEEIACRRRDNFNRLHQALGHLNLFDLNLEEGQVPLYYPFLSSSPLRQRLIASKIFVPHLWAEVQTRKRKGFDWEKRLARTLSPLPVDQRYNARDMDSVISKVTDLLKK